MSDFPGPFEPPSLTVPLPPPEVGEGSPWAPADGQNRDRILDYWRAWWRRVFFPWLASFITYLNTWLTDAEAYIIAHAIAGYSIRLTPDALNLTGTTDVEITLGEDVEFRPLVIGDVVLDQTIDSRFGVITVVIDDTHATVETQGSVKGTDGHGWWVTATVIAHTGTTPVVLTAESDRTVQLNDLIVDESASSAYGIVTIITDPTHVTVAFVNTLQGEQGIQGIPGPQGDPGLIQSVVAGANITVDDTDPANPIVSGAAGSGIVDSVVAGANITVDDTDAANPIVASTAVVASIIAGANITVDDTDPANPIVASTGGGGGVETIVEGNHILVDATDPANPIVSVDTSVDGLVASVTTELAPYNSDVPFEAAGTAVDPILRLNLIETSGAGVTSEVGGPATNLRIKYDDGTWTSRLRVGNGGIGVKLESFLDVDGSGAELNVTPPAAPGGIGNVFINDAIFNLTVLAADPAGTWTEGAMYYSSTTHAIRVYDGTTWS